MEPLNFKNNLFFIISLICISSCEKNNTVISYKYITTSSNIKCHTGPYYLRETNRFVFLFSNGDLKFIKIVDDYSFNSRSESINIGFFDKVLQYMDNEYIILSNIRTKNSKINVLYKNKIIYSIYEKDYIGFVKPYLIIKKSNYFYIYNLDKKFGYYLLFRDPLFIGKYNNIIVLYSKIDNSLMFYSLINKTYFKKSLVNFILNIDSKLFITEKFLAQITSENNKYKLSIYYFTQEKAHQYIYDDYISINEGEILGINKDRYFIRNLYNGKESSFPMILKREEIFDVYKHNNYYYIVRNLCAKEYLPKCYQLYYNMIIYKRETSKK